MESPGLVSATLSALAMLMVAGPARAGSLESWWFSSQLNQLVFTNDSEVQPQPQLLANPTWLGVDLPIPAAPSPNPNRVEGNNGGEAQTILKAIVSTGDGFLLQLTGPAPNPSLHFRGDSPDDRIAVIDLPDTAVTADLRPEDLPTYRYGVIGWEIVQQPTRPPSTRITLKLSSSSPEWRVLSSSNGVILLPPLGVALRATADQSSSLGPASSEPLGAIPEPVANAPALPPQPTNSEDLSRIPQRRRVVTIDPGHGGEDPGAVGIQGLQEKRVIFPISLRVAQLLEGRGIVVVLTRRQDSTVDLQTRVDIANQARADLFLSIHANSISLSRPEVNGVESYYYASDSSQRLAAILQARMLAATGMNDRGVKQARFYVLRHSNMPAALVEVGFVTGSQDFPRLQNPAWRETMAQAIAQGILEYLKVNP